MEKYKKLLLNLGADSVKIIEPKSIVTAPWTVFKCQFGCGHYGKSWCCPPKAPSYKETREIVDSYKTAILFGSHDWSTTERATKAAREMFLDGYYKTIAFGSGPCTLCKECNSDGCNFPEKIAPSMEACGIDVFQTVRNNGYEIETLRSQKETMNHFGLILVE